MVNKSEIVELLHYQSLVMVECCRGDIVIKVGNIQVESTTKHSATSTPSTSIHTTMSYSSSSTTKTTSKTVRE